MYNLYFYIFESIFQQKKLNRCLCFFEQEGASDYHRIKFHFQSLSSIPKRLIKGFFTHTHAVSVTRGWLNDIYKNVIKNKDPFQFISFYPLLNSFFSIQSSALLILLNAGTFFRQERGRVKGTQKRFMSCHIKQHIAKKYKSESHTNLQAGWEFTSPEIWAVAGKGKK